MKLIAIFSITVLFCGFLSKSDVIDDVQHLVQDINATESCGICPKIVRAGLWFLGSSGIVPVITSLICTGLAIGPVCDIAINSLTMLTKAAPADAICDTFGFETCHVITKRSITYPHEGNGYMTARSYRILGWNSTKQRELQTDDDSIKPPTIINKDLTIKDNKDQPSMDMYLSKLTDIFQRYKRAIVKHP